MLGVLTQPFYLLSKPDSPSLQRGSLATPHAKKCAKVLLFSDMCKFFGKKLAYLQILLYLCTRF